MTRFRRMLAAVAVAAAFLGGAVLAVTLLPTSEAALAPSSSAFVD
jgi:hypothetical protein